MSKTPQNRSVTPAAEVKEFIRLHKENYLVSEIIANQQQQNQNVGQLYKVLKNYKEPTTSEKQKSILGEKQQKHANISNRESRFYNVDIDELFQRKTFGQKSSIFSSSRYSDAQINSKYKPKKSFYERANIHNLEELQKDEIYVLLEKENIKLLDKYLNQRKINQELQLKLEQTEKIFKNLLNKQNETMLSKVSNGEQDILQNSQLFQQSQEQTNEIKKLKHMIKQQQQTIQNQSNQYNQVMQELVVIKNILFNNMQREVDQKLQDSLKLK